MNLKEMPKQQRDMLILSVMAVVTVVMVVGNLILTPAKAKALAADKVIEELEPKVRRGETILRRDRTNREEIATITHDMVDIHSKHLPPESGRYLWALQNLSDIGNRLGIAPTIREHSGARFVPSRQPFEEIRNRVSFWIPYAVEVQMETSYAQAGEFIRKLTESNPYVSVGKLSIETSAENKEIHQVSLIVEWPVPRDQPTYNALQKTLEDRP